MIRAMRRSPLALLLAGALAVALVAGGATPAAAKATRTTRYAMAQVWPAAVRFLRVDEGLEIVDKDETAGYVVFVMKVKESTKERELRGLRVDVRRLCERGGRRGG